MFGKKKGSMAGGLGHAMIQVAIAVLLTVMVAIPLIEDAIAAGNYTGTLATLLGIISTLLAVVLISAITSMM